MLHAAGDISGRPARVSGCSRSYPRSCGRWHCALHAIIPIPTISPDSLRALPHHAGSFLLLHFDKNGVLSSRVAMVLRSCLGLALGAGLHLRDGFDDLVRHGHPGLICKYDGLGGRFLRRGDLRRWCAVRDVGLRLFLGKIRGEAMGDRDDRMVRAGVPESAVPLGPTMERTVSVEQALSLPERVPWRRGGTL